ncbi:sodium/potassium/calcium exchanger 3-like [Erpetoichthys calabaricus]|uniref:sodium/potassium/calcium exchanger 3-like n=1 Tax=Erpetoichthys calabaricus TaxID=27687 RepID=UPI0022347E77|nr:sodium/potassium/calcium exchanger 3-like [Erpetoichthys calabaricus]
MNKLFRRRQRSLLQRLCFWCAGLLALSWISQLCQVTDGGPFISSSRLEPLGWPGRRLLSASEENSTERTVNCTKPAIHEFPQDIFSKEQRRKGAVLLHVLCAVYMFYALAIVCDDYFVPSLQKISENLHLSEDVAGATFMAAGSSAPELFTSLIGVFITKGDVGVGTIVGSAVFNILVIIGICGVFAGQTVPLTWWSLFRDSSYYTFTVIALILVIYDEKVAWWESIILITMYMVYILIMKFNSKIYSQVERWGPSRNQPRMVNGHQAAENNQHLDTSMVMLRKGRRSVQESSPVLMVDELFCLHPHQLNFPEASLRIMITQHFSPRTRLSMAGRMLINERQRLIRNRSPGGSSGSGGGTDTPVKASMADTWPLENGGPMENERQLLEEQRGQREEQEENEDEERRRGSTAAVEEEEEESSPFLPFQMPDGTCAKMKWLISWPFSCLLYCTVPNCDQPRWEKWFMVTFSMSTLWIAIFSYVMVWMVTIISYTLGIPDVIMGITFLAAGTSVPDCMASLIVARQGMGDMAVSNSIGSNIFDILLGLGFPWAMQTLVVDYGSSVFINSKGLLYSVILLLASVFLTVLSVHLNKWQLDRKLGLGILSLYTVFVLCSILIELNVLDSLPHCH